MQYDQFFLLWFYFDNVGSCMYWFLMSMIRLRTTTFYHLWISCITDLECWVSDYALFWLRLQHFIFFKLIIVDLNFVFLSICHLMFAAVSYCFDVLKILKIYKEESEKMLENSCCLLHKEVHIKQVYQRSGY